ncbi:MAG: polysulfide reductase NrfD [Candidatus Sericytochromatia bacterium]|nr:polysulfide reductase NrfD [Candidatus Tanganyikabacteria bacterium]
MNYILPNEAHTVWTIMIVLYPYITGLVAGAFILSSLYHVFGRKELKPVARFSLVAAFAFLLFASVPLLFHLGHPERAFNIMITPHFSSAMAGFGFIYSTYLIVVALEIWFVFRGDFIRRARGPGLIGLLCRLIVLGNLEETDGSRAADHKISNFLAAWGIPHACLLHGYVGFLFGSIKANIWWSTPLMFVIFIFSAIVSGIALLITGYMTLVWLKRWEVDQPCMRTMGSFLWGFMIFAVGLELLEVLFLAYQQTEHWTVLSKLITQQLVVSYVLLQLVVFSMVPFLLLASVVLFKVGDKLRNNLTWIASAMLLVQVLLMRWNVVVGGQLLSKSDHGFTTFHLEVGGREGLIVATGIMLAPFVVMWVFNKIVPIFPDMAAKPVSGAAPYVIRPPAR